MLIKEYKRLNKSNLKKGSQIKIKIYNKLVRDNIPEIMIQNGAKPVTKILNDEEYLGELNKKLQEELQEYLISGEIEELADIEEVLRSILKLKEIDYNEFENMRQTKANKRGSFNKKIFLEREE